MPQTLPMLQKLELLLLKSQRSYSRKIKSEKIKITIEVASTLTKIAHMTKTQVTTLIFQNLIV